MRLNFVTPPKVTENVATAKQLEQLDASCKLKRLDELE